MRLSGYIEQEGITPAELARRLGITRVHASELVREVARPSPDLAARISAESGGAVTVEELLYPKGIPSGAVMARDEDGEPQDGVDHGNAVVDPSDGSPEAAAA